MEALASLNHGEKEGTVESQARHKKKYDARLWIQSEDTHEYENVYLRVEQKTLKTTYINSNQLLNVRIK